MKNNKKITQNNAKKIFDKYGYSMIGKYIRSKDSIKCSDKDGYLYNINIINLQGGSIPMKFHVKNSYTIENIKKYIKINNIDTELLSTEYFGNNEFMNFKCSLCGEIYRRKLSELTSRKRGSYYCNSCVRNIITENQKLKESDVMLFYKKCGLKLIDFNYINNTKKNKVMNKDGYIGEISYNNLKNGKSFTIFSNVLNKENFLYNLNNYIKIKKINIEVLDIIPKNKRTDPQLIRLKCECGNTFVTTSTRFTSGVKIKCNRCCHKTSKIEIIMEDLLNKNKIKFKKEFWFKDCMNKKNTRPLFFDFYLEKYNLCIECDGRQHYELVNFGGITNEEANKNFLHAQENDNIKNNYCKLKSIELLRIPHYNFKTNEYIKKVSEYIPIKV